MPKLKLSPVLDEKPVRITIDVPAATHRHLVAYAEALGSQTGTVVGEPSRLIVPMLDQFMASDRAFKPKDLA